MEVCIPGNEETIEKMNSGKETVKSEKFLPQSIQETGIYQT